MVNKIPEFLFFFGITEFRKFIFTSEFWNFGRKFFKIPKSRHSEVEKNSRIPEFRWETEISEILNSGILNYRNFKLPEFQFFFCNNGIPKTDRISYFRNVKFFKVLDYKEFLCIIIVRFIVQTFVYAFKI